MAVINNYENTVRLAEQGLLRLGAADCAARSGAERIGDSRIGISLLSARYEVEWESDRVLVYKDSSLQDPVDWEGIVLLHHLQSSKGEAPSGEWESFRRQPGAWGGYSSSFEKRTTMPLIRRFGSDLQVFLSACQSGGGRNIDLESDADASIAFTFLPRVPIALQLWTGDEEFEARATVLFDRLAGDQLPIEDLTVSAQILVFRLIRLAGAPPATN